MREIINLSIGQGGNNIGKCFWETLRQEHSLDYQGNPENMSDYQRECLNVYFNEVQEGQYQARSLQVDSEPGLLDGIQASAINTLFNPDSYLYDQCGAGNCFGKGRNQLEMDDKVLDEVRKLVEQSDCLQGFQLIRSLGGGTGSGFGDKIQTRVLEEFPDKLIVNFCICPSPYVSDTVVEPYNCVLSMPGIIDNSNLCFTFDNEALYNIVTKTIGVKQPVYSELNQILSRCISGATTQWRFPAPLYNNIRAFSVNLIPFEKLVFVNTGLSSLHHRSYIPNKPFGISEMVRSLKNNRNFLNHCTNMSNTVEFGSLSIFRGNNLCESDILAENEEAYKYDKFYQNFWIPDNQRTYKCQQQYSYDLNDSALKLQSGSSIKEMLQKQLERFHVMFKRKAFLHYGYGDMDEMEFTEAYSILTDTLAEYNDYENCGFDQFDSSDRQVDEQESKEKSFEQRIEDFTSIKFNSSNL